MAKKVDVQRDAGHPWDQRKGFDLMVIDCDTECERDEVVKAAESKFWQSWIVGFHSLNSKPSAVFYKPSGLNEPWVDTADNPHPGCVDGALMTALEADQNNAERRARSES